MIGNQLFHCTGVLLGLRSAATQLSGPETQILLDLAKGATNVAEIGVFEGLTSRRMIEVMPSGSRMFCVDPFFAGRLGVAYGELITRAQIRRAGRSDVQVEIVRKLSHEFAPEMQVPLDLIFIDADHSYSAVRRDWQDWSPKVRVGGRIALHDSQPMAGRCPETCGPVRLVRELGDAPAGFEKEATRDTITVFRRVA